MKQQQTKGSFDTNENCKTTLLCAKFIRSTIRYHFQSHMNFGMAWTHTNKRRVTLILYTYICIIYLYIRFETTQWTHEMYFDRINEQNMLSRNDETTRLCITHSDENEKIILMERNFSLLARIDLAVFIGSNTLFSMRKFMLGDG